MNEKQTLLANPGPLGLFGFGLTTVLLNLSNAGIIEYSVVIIAMGLCYGGFAQLLAGIFEFKNGNTFGTIAFISYATFWWSLVIILILPEFKIVPAANNSSLAAYFIMWGIFTFIMFLTTFQKKATMLVFLTLFILFFLLAAEKITGNHALGVFTGYEGILCGAIAIYDGAAQIINDHFGRKILPL